MPPRGHLCRDCRLQRRPAETRALGEGGEENGPPPERVLGGRRRRDLAARAMEEARKASMGRAACGKGVAVISREGSSAKLYYCRLDLHRVILIQRSMMTRTGSNGSRYKSDSAAADGN
ncbi:hypothetical protein GUJ93_ZPchr0001g32661 [Zizania palustris]|uniref:Uncharacterized protein n=1 Tax=Zizania palustris TaxID=103762 RepID=A0A8J5VPQ3_ZIZPA|nr:hypothetical protein GUJ93_ZPchr0001g32661 [Zizania palustris]